MEMHPNRYILTTGRFLSRNRQPLLPVSYNVGYAYSPVLAGVSLTLTNNNQEHLNFALTPDQAEALAAELSKWAIQARKYQNQTK